MRVALGEALVHLHGWIPFLFVEQVVGFLHEILFLALAPFARGERHRQPQGEPADMPPVRHLHRRHVARRNRR